MALENLARRFEIQSPKSPAVQILHHAGPKSPAVQILHHAGRNTLVQIDMSGIEHIRKATAPE